MRSEIFISIGFLIVFLLVSPFLAIPNTLAQSDALTDSHAATYFSNPSSYTDKNVNFTGKILSLFPPSSGTQGLQMYQAGETNRNTIVIYTTPIQLSKDDCVRVTGISQPVTEYLNMFGATLSAAAINANSISKIHCSESIEPARNIVNVDETQEKNSVIITLHNVEFSDKNTRAYLTVQNTDPINDITFYDHDSRAIQGKSQFMTTNSYDVDYPNIESTIPSGIEENGVVLFEPIDPTTDKTQFRFEASKGIDDIKFTFDVILSTIKFYDAVLPTDLDNITALVNAGNALSETGNPLEAIKYYDKALSIDANNITALVNAGNALSETGNPLEAIKYYDKALSIDANNTKALVGKANNLGDSHEAMKYYNKATSIDPRVFLD
ncbi:tetratricopeptide repeat protein [Candidatus Nitrosocosmicus arcticus]|uniref:Tetratricopeptide repeat protein n=1 Tax=Candidatus Nitrosocosmicus arcticus TaxID=2035267 RepID=A0A557SVY9_9ARCH|nr:tetratricopeptide repeat protein [Candidatus Nitrosocosmicus arcticus]TVP40768.1 exported protein of unknown function [Candidatus Nitrosocosmicus arcticus]